MISLIVWVLVLAGGILLMTLASEWAVKHSVILASALGMSPIMIGLILVSLGTDLPEIVNSIVSSSLGHGDVNAGDSIGSVLAQITLVLGILSFLGRPFKVRRRDVLIMGACQILSLMLVISIVEKGYISRINALFLVGSWPIYMLLTGFMIKRGHGGAYNHGTRSKMYHLTLALAGLGGVAAGAYAVVQSVITLSTFLGIPKYLISFFLAGIGTSLPELAVDLMAIRKGEYELAIGDVVGSCIVDASVSIGIGQVLFPQAVSGGLASITTLYTVFASFMVILTLAVREVVDRKAGTLFLALYLLSYLMLV